MAHIKFEIENGESTFLDPRNGFQETTHHFEVRLDPLTGRSGHFSHFGVIKPQKLPLSDYEKSEIKGLLPLLPGRARQNDPEIRRRSAPGGKDDQGRSNARPEPFPL